MLKNSVVVVGLFVMSALLASAEPTRVLMSTENKQPELRQLEAGLMVDSVDSEISDATSLAPYVRYGLLPNLTAQIKLPYEELKSLSGQYESGLGDVELGFELMAYEDIFDFPYVIPHVSFSFPTGDDEVGLGNGETVTTYGLALGTTVADVYNYVLDFQYAVNGGSDEPGARQNIGAVAGAFIWDVSKKFSVLTEVKFSQSVMDTTAGESEFSYSGGLSYKAMENLQLSVYAGSSQNTDADGFAAAKAAYTF